MVNKLNPWLLAASIVVAGAASMGQSAMAITSVEELSDLNTNHWAYEALTDLVEKYDVIEGYPSGTFKGNRFATRYEMAAALDALIKAVGRDLARLGAEKANKADLETLAKLQDEFAAELATVRGRVDALEARATAIEEKNAEQDDRLDLLEKTQLHGDFTFGFLSDYGGNARGTSTTQREGISDSLSTFGRLRLGLNVPVYQGAEDSKIGDGNVVARLVSAFGSTGPRAAENGNAGDDIAAFSGYNGIAASASNGNEGTQSNGLNTRLNTYVDQAYYKQHLKPGIPLLTDLTPGIDLLGDDGLHDMTADAYAGVLSWRNLFNRSPYRGDETTQFVNTSLVNNPGLLANFVAPGVAMAWHQGLGETTSLDVTGAVLMPNTANGLSPFIVSEEAVLHYDLASLFGGDSRPGSLTAGAYHIISGGTGSLTQFGGQLPSSNLGYPGTGFPQDGSLTGLYAGVSQEIYRGIGFAADYVYNTGGVDNAVLTSLRNGTGSNLNFVNNASIQGIRQAATAVVSVPLSSFLPDLTSRGRDTIGVGYAWIDPLNTGTQLPYNTGSEHAIEAFYRLQLTDSISVIPSVQVIQNAYGNSDNGTYFVGSVRANYVF